MCIIILNHDIWCLLLIFVLPVFRILAIKSGPSSGIKVFLQQSQKDNKNRVILPDDKWQSVGTDYQQVDLSKFEGRNFASKLELLLATFSHDLSSSSSWNKLFSSLLLRFLSMYTPLYLFLEGLLTLLPVCLPVRDFFDISLKYWKLVKKVGRGARLLKISNFICLCRSDERIQF